MPVDVTDLFREVTLEENCELREISVILFTDGAQFFSLVKSLARRYGDNKKLHFLWVDPDPFPTVSYKCTTGWKNA